MSRIEFKLPDVGEGLSEGEIVRWLVAAGDTVSRDQIVVEVETDKSIVELPAPADGTIVELGAAEGDMVPIGELLLILETADAAAGEPDDRQDDTSQPVETAVTKSEDAPTTPDRGSSGPRRVKAAPSVRKLAVQHGVDLADVKGSGPSGRITKEDLQQHLDAPEVGGMSERVPPSVPPARAGETGQDLVEPLRGMRRQIAKTMTAAWQQVPHITDIREIDATALVVARRRLAEDLADEVERFTFLPLMIRAVTATLATSPKFNASIDLDDETITYHGSYNIGLAAATDDGLMVPVLHDADRLGLAEIARRVDQLATGARDRSLAPEQLRQGTCTITNYGSFGGWIATPIIRPPEAAIVGFGRIRDTVVAVDGMPVVRPTLPISVSADHRLIDGDDMGGFLNRLTALLEDPILLLAGGR